ncbi:MAG: Fimbrial assembly protein (PilN) [Bacteroidetes bacterium]|nr:Fimbrial assembly protein (PilN) [Bacteroidota bacterium]
MASMKGPGKTVLGIFVDGLDVKVAHLSVKGKRVVVQELRSATLVSKLEERKSIEVGVGAEGADAFSLPLGGATQVAEGQSEDNNAVLLNLLAQYPSSKYSLTYSIAEPAIYYHVLESDMGLKGKKLKEHVLSELRNIRSFQPAHDAVDAIKTEEGNLLCVIREDGLSLINSLENIKSFIGRRLPRIPAIDSADISLMNMVRLNYDLQPTEVSVVVYVGAEFTRLIFMRGNQFYQFAPILGEGYDSPNLQNTVYSRLLLEQDNLGIPRISKIILAGESRRINFKEFLTQQLPDQDVDYLLSPQLDSSPLPADQQEAISEYAIPIGAAWKVLQPTNPNVYNVNLLPDIIREGQRVFKLAWHGVLFLLLLFASTFFFTYSIVEKNKSIADLEELLERKRSQLAENETLQNSINGLQEQIGRYQTSLALYDTLVPGSERWSTAFTQLSHGVEDLNSIWLTDFSSSPDARVAMNGYTVYRTRIPRLATLFDNSVLKEVNVQAIREQTVYRYRIEVPAPAVGQ